MILVDVNSRWRLLLPMAVVLPLAAYVVGSLMQATGGEPPAREPIVLIDETEGPEDQRNRPRDRGDDGQTEGPVVTPDPVEDDDDDSGADGSGDREEADGGRGGDDDEADDDDDGGDD